jgi:hypothetical protein
MQILQNYEKHDSVLSMNEEFQNLQLSDRSALIGDKFTSYGFFVVREEGVCGVIKSKNGPVFFAPNIRTLIKRDDFQLQISQVDGLRQVLVSNKNNRLFDCAYSPPKDWGIDDWSAQESSADFFLWLKESLVDEYFFKYYSI